MCIRDSNKRRDTVDSGLQQVERNDGGNEERNHFFGAGSHKNRRKDKVAADHDDRHGNAACHKSCLLYTSSFIALKHIISFQKMTAEL